MPTARKLPSGNWRVRVFVGHMGGRATYKSITAATKREAEYMAASYLANKTSSMSCISVGDAVDRYIDSKTNVLSPATIAGYRKVRRNHINSIEKIKLDCLTNEDIQRWINAKAAIISAKSVSNMYGLLHATILMLRPNFCPNIRLPKRVKQLRRDLPTSEEVIRAVRDTPVELPVLLSLCLCLRLSEVRGLKKTAVEGDLLYIENVKITVDGQDVEKKLAKTDSSRRVIKISKTLKDMIEKCEGLYITTMSGKAIYSRFTRLMKKAGYDHVRFHDLRHIAASDMNKLGITDRIAADRGGWATTTTMRNVYQHSFSADRDKAEYIIQDFYESIMTEND